MIARILRLLYSRYVPEPARNSLRVTLALLVRDREPLRTVAPKDRRVVVLAPHMDDEVFGCGGTLALAAANGCDVTVVYVTDGSKGYPKPSTAGRSAAAVAAFERALSATREEEACRAGRILGFRPPRFLGLADGALAVTSSAVGRLAAALSELRPEVVFLPFMTDLHHDHWLTNGLFYEAARRAGLPPTVECWGYEVWIPLPANVVVDIGDTIETKRRAMEAFASQRTEYDYWRAILALSVYRSLFTTHGGGWAEAFYRTDLALYRALYGSIAVGHRRHRAAAGPARGPRGRLQETPQA